MSPTIEQSVVKLFQNLELRGIRYAVLRNYELFPSLRRAGDLSPHTDIDLVVDSRQLDLLREVLAKLAHEDGWDGLAECDHWARSDVRHHNIEVFRFHRSRPLEYLQVDVFHSYLLWGLPLFVEGQMLQDSVYDTERGLRRIDPLKENVYRLIQIHGLYPGSERKRNRYRQRVLAFRSSNRQSLDLSLAAVFGRYGMNAIDHLASGNIRGFLRNMFLGRLRFAVRFALRRPLEIPVYFFSRLRENIGRFYTQQCGVLLRVAVRDEGQRQLVREAMNALVDNSFIDEWREYENLKHLSLSDHVAMEQGAIVVEWANAANASLDLRSIEEPLSAVDAIIRVCSARHKVLFTRVHAPVRAAAEASTR